MPTVALFNMKGEKTGSMEVAESVFGADINQAVIHTVITNYLANQRQGTQSTKTRTEVRGGGAKPWRQKGTGRARQGSIRSPQWTGGGVALGPKPRDYRYPINKKLKKIALRSALSAKYQSYDVVVVEDLSVDEIKTKTIADMLKALEISGKALIVTAECDEKIYKSARNIKDVKATYVDTMNTYEVLNGGKFVVSKDAVKKLEEVLSK